jgi:integral membrane sensor domain MASE1
MRVAFFLILKTLLIAIGYILAAKLGFFLAFLNSQVSPVWPPEGVAFAAIVLMGTKCNSGYSFWCNTSELYE